MHCFRGRWVVYADAETFPADLIRVPSGFPINGKKGGQHGPDGEFIGSDNFTIPLATYTFYIMLVVFGVLSLNRVRRAHFELFYYSHHFFIVVYIVALYRARDERRTYPFRPST
jgi:hypothetical protein